MAAPVAALAERRPLTLSQVAEVLNVSESPSGASSRRGSSGRTRRSPVAAGTASRSTRSNVSSPARSRPNPPRHERRRPLAGGAGGDIAGIGRARSSRLSRCAPRLHPRPQVRGRGLRRSRPAGCTQRRRRRDARPHDGARSRAPRRARPHRRCRMRRTEPRPHRDSL